MRMFRPLLVVAASLAFFSAAQENPPKKLVGTKKVSAPKLDLPTFTDLPKDQQLQKPKTDPEQTAPSSARADESYTVVKVQHARSFLRSPDGAKPTAPFSQVNLVGPPPLTSEKFSSIIRVKSPAKRSAHIEVAILDTRGDTLMEADGELSFRTSDETEWSVDWSPTTMRTAGEFQVLVRIAGNPIGTYPIKFAETPK